MAHYLPSSSDRAESTSPGSDLAPPESEEQMADLKVFWGPEICRLEYLVHLVDTGRIKDEYRTQSA